VGKLPGVRFLRGCIRICCISTLLVFLSYRPCLPPPLREAFVPVPVLFFDFCDVLEEPGRLRESFFLGVFLEVGIHCGGLVILASMASSGCLRVAYSAQQLEFVLCVLHFVYGRFLKNLCDVVITLFCCHFGEISIFIPRLGFA